MFFAPALDHLWHVGIGPFIIARDNPQLYPFILVALIVIIVSSLLYLVRDLFHNGRLSALTDDVLLLILGSASVYLVWLSFATPVDRLPFGLPTPGSMVWIIPLLAVYSVIAVTVHVVISITGGLFMAAALASIPPVNSGRSDKLINVALFGAVILTIVGWELSNWPGIVLIPVELILAYELPTEVVRPLRRAIEGHFKFHSPQHLYRAQRSVTALDYTLTIAGTFWVLLAHIIQPYIVTFGLVLWVFVLLDDAMWIVFGIPHPQRILRSPLRWLVTIPLVLVVVGIGASGILLSVTADTALTPSFWLDVGAAAGAYMLFKPLIELAKAATEQREESGDQDTVLGVVRGIADRVTALVSPSSVVAATSGGIIPAEPVPAAFPSAGEIRESATAPTNGGIVPDEAEHFEFLTTIDISEATYREVTVSQAHPIASRLVFPTYTIFLVAGILYHYLITQTEFSAILSSSLGILVFGLMPLLAGLLPILNRPVLQTPRYVLLIFIYAILITTGINAFLVIAQVGDHLLAGARGWLSPMLDLNALAAAGHQYAQAFLVLVTVGQVIYLFVFMAATLVADQTEMRITDREGWYAFGLWLADRDQYQQALQAYAQAKERDPRSPLPWLGAASALYNVEKYALALQASQVAIDLNASNPFAWYLHARIHDKLGHWRAAALAMRHAISLARGNALYWNYLGGLLTELEEYHSAARAYRQATRLAPRNADYQFDLAYHLVEHLHDAEQALIAIEHALKLVRDWPAALYIKGTILVALGRQEEATKLFLRVLELTTAEPRQAGTANLRAYAYLRLERYTEALASIDRAIALAPDEARYYDSKGEIYLTMGPEYYERALVEFERALALEPSLMESLRNAALVLHLLGRTAEARRYEERSRAIIA